MNPAVSIIILVYKAEKYIERCARSLFGQTMEDLEFIFVDDCTPDTSMDVLERVLVDYPQRRSRVKVLRNDVNRGRAYSRRRGVEAAAGDYIIHCDSDDWAEPEMYARLYAKALDESLDMVVCRMRRVYPDHVVPVPCIANAGDIVESLLYMDVRHYLLDKLISRRAYEAPPVWPENDMCEDTALIIQLACHCRTWGFVEEELYNYDCSSGGISASVNSLEKVEQIRSNVDLAISCLEARGLGGRYTRAILHLKGWAKIAAFGLPRRYYVRLYPEADLPLFADRRFTVAERLGHLTKLLGLHGISKPFKKKKK